ncbi:MAG: Na/Pi cotransporter family protein [Bdellovibrionaceae bacterium]|nr:Na/Pi cotransporter family protein [Pseudobdellovibrionaceae bacterium]
MSIEETFSILFFTLTGASVVIILGSKIITDSLVLLFPRTVHFFLNQVGESRWLNSLGGTFVSALTQTPISTSHMAISFGNSGLYSRNQVSAFLSGAGLAALWPFWLIVFDWGWYELIFLTVGFFPAYLATNERIVALGRLILGTGLIILGSRLLKMGLATLPQWVFLSYQSFFSGPLNLLSIILVLFLAIVILFAMRSFLVPLAITLALFDANFISGLYATVFLVSIFFSLSLIPFLNWNLLSTEVKKALIFQFIAKSIFTIFAIFFANEIFELLKSGSNLLFISSKMMGSQSPENLITTHFLPMTFLVLNFAYLIWSLIAFSPIMKFVDKIVPEKKIKEFQKLEFIGEIHNVSSSLSIEQVRLEVRKMAAMVESMLHLTQEVLGSWQPNPKAVEKILKYEAVTDRLQVEMNAYLSRLMQLNLTSAQGTKVKGYFRMTKELENIADCCKALFFVQRNLGDSGRLPHKEVTDNIKDYFSDLLSSYELLFTDLADDESESIFLNQTVDENFRAKSLELNSKYLLILKQAYSSSKSEGANHWVGEMMFNLDQIHRHTSNFYEAYCSRF